MEVDVETIYNCRWVIHRNLKKSISWFLC